MKPEKNLVFVPVRNGKPAHYLTEITLNYRRVRRFAGFTKEEARARLAELRIAAKQGRLGEVVKPERPKDLFGEYARAVLDSAEWKKKRSAERDETSLLHLNREFKDCRLVDIKPGTVRRYITRRLEEGAAPASTNRELSLLKSLLYAAEADELIPTNPIRGRRVKKQPENNNREKTILGLNLTDDVLRRLVESAAEYLKPILKIALSTGMRRDEILKTKWKDFNPRLGSIRIPAENAKSKKERVVRISPTLCVELDGLLRIGEYIFLNPETGQRRKDVREGFVSACKAAGIPTGRGCGLVFHDLRHVAAFRLVRETDVVTASKILGHSTLDMTLRYCHPSEKDRALAVDKVFEKLFGGRQKDVNTPETAPVKGLEKLTQLN